MNILTKAEDRVNGLLIRGSNSFRATVEEYRDDRFVGNAVKIGGAVAAVTGASVTCYADSLEKKINDATKKLVGLITGVCVGLAVLATVAVLLTVFFSRKAMDDAWSYIKKIWVAVAIIWCIGGISAFLMNMLGDDMKYK